MPRITVDEISRKEFSFANKGYNQKEVDDFLDDICDEMERMESEIMDLKRELTHIYVTHAHPDHYWGTAYIAEQFPGVKCIAARSFLMSPTGWFVRS